MIEHEQAFYDTYSFFFDLPFDSQKKHRLFHGLIAGEPWAWQVIGITEEALKKLAENDFNRTPKQICRAHFVDRTETSKKIFTKKIPREEFFEDYFRMDRTVISLTSENRRNSPPPLQFIPINPKLKLFTSTMTGFRYDTRERKHLKELYTDYKAGKVSLQSA